jgi:hypothetical protein
MAANRFAIRTPFVGRKSFTAQPDHQHGGKVGVIAHRDQRAGRDLKVRADLTAPDGMPQAHRALNLFGDQLCDAICAED